MTEVEFFTGVAEPIDFACRLVRKAYRKGARLFVAAPPETLRALDRALWVFDERDFVPHIKIEGLLPAAAQRTPVWLSAGPRFEGVHRARPRRDRPGGRRALCGNVERRENIYTISKKKQ